MPLRRALLIFERGSLVSPLRFRPTKGVELRSWCKILLRRSAAFRSLCRSRLEMEQKHLEDFPSA